MKRLLVLVDSRRYIRENCYQRQLMATLELNFQVRMLSLREIKYAPWAGLGSHDIVLSVLKQRTLDANLASVARVIRGAPLYIYDQDPWQAYMDDSANRGAYVRFSQSLNVAKLLLTSKWWADFVGEKGLPTEFVRMGMLPNYCDAGPGWENRDVAVGFQGTLHPHRKVFYDRLAEMDLTVQVFPSTSYEGYLQTLHRMQIYLHTEDAPWTVNGQSLPRNALWIKETEVAARGAFAIRDHETEAEAYGISELPTIFTYQNVEEVPGLVASIQGMNLDEKNDRMQSAAATMRQRDDWMTVVRAIEA